MKKHLILIILMVLFSSVCFSAQTKSKKLNVRKKVIASKIKKKKSSGGLILSGGVVNGKAVNLVKPEYPLAAKRVNARGTVKVSVLIDESGKVIEAKAYSGHPLLKANSVKAALESEFSPVTIGGNPVKVRGVIVYHYVSDIYNWLEIGNGLSGGRFLEMLPNGFNEEKQIFEQYQLADNDALIFQNLKASIENKISSNPKHLWLFQIGILLNDIKLNCCREDNLSEPVSSLKILLINAPENVTSALIKKLNNLVRLSENPQLNTYDPSLGSKFYRQLEDIYEKLPMLGD